MNHLLHFYSFSMQKPFSIGLACISISLASCAGLQRQNMAFVPPDPEAKKVVWVEGKNAPEAAVPEPIEDSKNAKALEELRQNNFDEENIASNVFIQPSQPLTQDYQVIAQEQPRQRSIALVDNATEKNLKAVHTVKRGETVYSISKKYNLDPEVLSRANNLTNNLILVGQVLAIPSGEISYNSPQAPQSEVSVVSRILDSTSSNSQIQQPQKPWISPFAEYGVKRDFVPQGSYMQRYVIINSPNNQVQAMRAGKIVFLGEFEGFDSMVIVEHDQGFVSIYGNMDENAFRVNLLQEVDQGDILGTALGGDLKLLVQKTGDEPTNPIDLIRN